MERMSKKILEGIRSILRRIILPIRKKKEEWLSNFRLSMAFRISMAYLKLLLTHGILFLLGFFFLSWSFGFPTALRSSKVRSLLPRSFGWWNAASVPKKHGIKVPETGGHSCELFLRLIPRWTLLSVSSFWSAWYARFAAFPGAIPGLASWPRL